jgi:hypothetical protein
MEPGYKVTDQ